MKILSWNINGLKKNWSTLLQLMAVELPEIVCIQNFRSHNYTFPPTLDVGLPTDETYNGGQIWIGTYARISARTTLCNGVGMYVRSRFFQQYDPQNTEGAYEATAHVYRKHAALSASGRMLALELQPFTLITVLPPAASQIANSPRAVERQNFDNALLQFLTDLRKEVPVVVTGDFKVAHTDADVHPACGVHWPAPPIKGLPPHAPPLEPSYVPLRVNPWIRQMFTRYRYIGLYDALRLFNNRTDLYTCFYGKLTPKPGEKKPTNWQLNQGWRTDYFLVDRRIQSWVQDCTVLSKIMGSQNVPIKLTLDLPPPIERPWVPPPEEPPPIYPDLDWDPTYYDGSKANNPYFPPPGD